MIGFINTVNSFSQSALEALQATASGIYLIPSSHTSWGFESFTVPVDEQNITSGGDIQAAMDLLPDGGTINLAAGTYSINTLSFNTNIVLQGVSKETVTITFDATGSANSPLMEARGNITPLSNLIVRNMTINCTGNGNANGIEFIYGVENILVENIGIYNAGKSNVIIYNSDWEGQSRKVTFKDIESYNAGIHNLSMRFTTSALVQDCESYGASSEYGLDLSRVYYAEVVGMNNHDNNYGSKYPGSNYLYIHDSAFTDNTTVAMNIMRNEESDPLIYAHIENTTITNCAGAIVDWGDTLTTPNHAEFVVTRNTFSSNTYDYIRINGVSANGGHEFGDNIGLLVARSGTVAAVTHATGVPSDYGVGYTTWGNPS